MKNEIQRTITRIWIAWMVVMIGLTLLACEPDEQTKTCYCETMVDGIITGSDYNVEQMDIECFKFHEQIVTPLGTIIETNCGEL